MRVTSSVTKRQRHKKILKQAKGYFGSKHRLVRTAKEQVMNSGNYAFRDRRQKKRDFRKLWITRINAACHQNDISYSKFISGLKKAGSDLNRKVLADIAVNDEKAFSDLVKLAKEANNKPLKKENSEVLEYTVEAGKKAPAKKETKAETKEVKKEAKKESKKDLESLTVAELKEMAKEKGLTGFSALKKADLIKELQK